MTAKRKCQSPSMHTFFRETFESYVNTRKEYHIGGEWKGNKIGPLTTKFPFEPHLNCPLLQLWPAGWKAKTQDIQKRKRSIRKEMELNMNGLELNKFPRMNAHYRFILHAQNWSVLPKRAYFWWARKHSWSPDEKQERYESPFCCSRGQATA